MVSKFKTLLVAGVALPVLAGVALAQSAPVGTSSKTTVTPPAVTAPSAAPAPAAKAGTSVTTTTPAAKAEGSAGTTVKSDAVKSDAGKADAGKADATAGTKTELKTDKKDPAKSSAVTGTDTHKTAMVKKHRAPKKVDDHKAGTVDKTSSIHAPAQPQKAGDIGTTGSAAKKL
jgi:hypothetical protein